MSENLTLDDLTVPMRALRALAVDFPDLPAPTLEISTIWPKRLELTLYDDLAPFETWRVALGIAPDDVQFREQGNGRTWVLEASGEFAGAELKLVAYGDSLDSLRESSGDEGGDA
ncbi:hypothetical protein FNV65_37175 [Streptomyces sp. S1A1-8]|uniref:hypothetical protein n=1 Tax=unclassified Streptomyces TaxID=2593676 RepID=UPI001162DF8E|nr:MULTISPECIES: hypothetical protein [unclassified Streptomyces]QDO01118.1 hypothetical protein FNV58_38595 [Streptomyces sp. RLB1-9]QDO22848.1 hypothetical protein FNV65_37175 [Streptomyces sp. S1A1-8]QDO32975.1 hypothetical protein FNV63_37195 [Streptomyces sp. S1A1-3]